MAVEDILSKILRAVRLTGSVHFCLSPSGCWQSSARPTMVQFGRLPGSAVPFHIISEGQCWVKVAGRTILLQQGDVIAFPFATPHQLGHGEDGQEIDPLNELPERPWSDIPTVQRHGGENQVRILCGFLFCSALGFKPMTDHIPAILHARAEDDKFGWMQSTIDHIEQEIAAGHAGSPILERLTETMFLQMLRQEIDTATPAAKGWLAAIADPAIGKCIAAIHDAPDHDWTIEELAKFCGVSQSGLSERFLRQVDVSPVRYVREWRLHIARVSLAETNKTVAEIGYDAGYGSEAAFNRAFSKTYDIPPAKWRQLAQAHREGAV